MLYTNATVCYYQHQAPPLSRWGCCRKELGELKMATCLVRFMLRLRLHLEQINRRRQRLGVWIDRILSESVAK